VESAATVIRSGRARLALSTRDLARLAGVAYPTVSRIENGHDDPRWSTMARLIAVLTPPGAGAAARPLTRITDLAATGLTDLGGGEHPEFTALRAFVDQFAVHPEWVAAAIAEAPAASRSALLDNILAAIAEQLADDAGIRRPAWTRRVPPLPEPWVVPGTSRMRARDEAAATAAFAARGLFIAADAIWRQRRVVDA
jgi:DNA-binding XRE family transcriptional regulator